MRSGEFSGDPSDFDPAGNFHGLREMIRQANAPIVAEVFGERLAPDNDLLEVGCGTGELYRMVPEAYRQNYTGIEIDPASIEKNQELHPGTRLVEADVRDLPFADNSVSAVTALDLLDIMPDYMRGVREIKRVLKPGGYFIHFHDCRPNMDFVARQIPGNLIPFPHTEPNGTLRRFQLLPVTDYRAYRPDRRLDHYVLEVRNSFDLLEPARERMPRDLDMLVELVNQRYAGKLSLSPTFREIFNEVMKRTAINSGMKLTELAERGGTTEMTPENVASLLLADPTIPLGYGEGGTLIADGNGVLMFFGGSEQASGPPMFLSELSVAVFQKSGGRRA